MNKLAATLAALPVAALSAAAQSTNEVTLPAPAYVPGQAFTVGQLMEYGGILMYPLIATSIVGLAMIIYFAVVLREQQILPRAFVANLRQLLQSKRLVEAQAACRGNPSPIAAVAASALEYRLRVDTPDLTVLHNIVEGEGSRQAVRIQGQVTYLADLGGVAPMMGLLGTVIGMLKAFSGVAYDIAKAKPIVLAGGVSQALITTVAGLIVAIPAMIAYSYFRGRAMKCVSQLESVSAEMLALMTREDKP
jgi:biopolymer transport protein ExbB